MKEVKGANDFIEMEHEVLDYWEKNNSFKKLQEKNKDNEPFRFIDGPITANNPMGVHHAWGRTLKDIFIRYKAMNGYTCHYRNGFDAQGLWLEVEVEKELGFKNKKDVEEYGLDKFTTKCMDRVKKFSGVITEQSKRLGQWMDWDNSYFTNTEENITSIWYFLNKCHENGWIKQSFRPMPWCPRCGTSLSDHEMSGSYKNLTHKAVFFKLPVVNKDFKMLVWTTTPWTLSSNVALAVNEELDYVKVKVKSDEKPLVLCKSAIKALGEDKVEVLEIFKGKDLVGLEYETCFPELEPQKEIKHRVVAWEDVGAEEGSGIVHIAPGCGSEDYELGKREKLDMVIPVDDLGIFLEGFGFLTGLTTKEAAEVVFARLEEDNKLYKTHEHTHSYPVCWRCKTEVIYKAVREWCIDTEELRPRLIKAANSVKWEPEHIGKRMNDWLTNMDNWAISRKRFYGLPLPFYVCEECNKLTVVSSREDLREKAVDPAKVDAMHDLHRPWIDDIEIKCTCGHHVKRITDVGDCWLDAGIVPFSTLGYFKDREKWNKYYPAEFVSEMKEQVRLWFYSLLFMSVVLEDKAPYEKVLSYGSVVSEDGTKFSKTGFMIKFDEAAEKIGADSARYLYAGANTNADVRFGFNLGEEARRKLLNFYNIYVFFNTYASLDKDKLDNMDIEKENLTLTDKWLLAKVNTFIAETKAAYNDFDTQTVVRKFESLVDDISNFYIRVNRKRFWEEGMSTSKKAAYASLYTAIKEILKVMAPIIPFMTEYLWNTLVLGYENYEEESVHLTDFPKTDSLFANEKLEADVDKVRKVISLGLLLRNENQIKVRQPLTKLFVKLNDENVEAVKDFEKIIKEELNMKEIEIISDPHMLNDMYLSVNFKEAGKVLKKDVQKLKEFLEGVSREEADKMAAGLEDGVETPFGKLAKELFVLEERPKANIISAKEDEITVAMDIEITEELKIEGIYRDLVRAIQVFRKELDLKIDQRINLGVISEDLLVKKAVEEYLEKIKQETLADSLKDTVLENKQIIKLNDTDVELYIK